VLLKLTELQWFFGVLAFLCWIIYRFWFTFILFSPTNCRYVTDVIYVLIGRRASPRLSRLRQVLHWPQFAAQSPVIPHGWTSTRLHPVRQTIPTTRFTQVPVPAKNRHRRLYECTVHTGMHTIRDGPDTVFAGYPANQKAQGWQLKTCPKKPPNKTQKKPRNPPQSGVFGCYCFLSNICFWCKSHYFSCKMSLEES
jgi:hypothetical protein